MMSFISRGVIKPYPLKYVKKLNLYTVKLLNLANNMFICQGVNMKIVHTAEMEALALANMINADAIVVDERNIRVLVENPRRLAGLLSKKLHSPVKVNKTFENDFLNEVKDVKVIRSVELMAVAYDFGITDRYIIKKIILPKVSILEKAFLRVSYGV